MDQEEEAAKRGFTISDRRGQNNTAVAPVVKQEAVDSAPLANRVWKNVGFRVILAEDQNKQPLVMGQAAGLANDENVFVTNYVFPPMWSPGFDWTIDAKRRLDTFLNCQCSMKVGTCAYHRRMSPMGWFKEDQERIRDISERPVPEVFEVLFKSERTREAASRILAPRR